MASAQSADQGIPCLNPVDLARITDAIPSPKAHLKNRGNSGENPVQIPWTPCSIAEASRNQRAEFVGYLGLLMAVSRKWTIQFAFSIKITSTLHYFLNETYKKKDKASCAKFSECQILCDSNDISPPLTDQTRVSAPFEANVTEQGNK
jgi:hypothetical protein